MPTYVYRFVETGETIEVQQAFHDDALTEAVHPTTGVTMPVKKVFTPVGVTFKGGGFYKTDSRGSGRAAPAKSDGGDSSSTTETKSTSSDKAATSTSAAGNGSSGGSTASTTPAATSSST